MAPHRTERKLAAILSADVVGYSRLMVDDEAATVEAVRETWELLDGLIRQHGGRVVDAVGDNLLADFPSVVDAVACGVLLQQELRSRNAELAEHRRMLLRIGINLGDVLVDQERIYGDGVNIAARVQALAEPGGVAISRAAFDQVEEKLDLEFEDLGEHAVKNIPKPIRVYRVAVSEGREGHAARAIPGFSGRPAIAVLPFDNLSGDAEQDYFADGIAEDLITRLAAWRLFPVIARNSSFVYRGKAVDIRRVGRELGARFVVEGSVRRAADRVRVSAQLIDATTGEHVWSERYDRELRDIFTLQDEITEAIAGRIGPEVLHSEQDRSARMEPEAMQAWDLTQRGFWHLWKFTREDSVQARSFFQRAIELDDGAAPAFLGLSLFHSYGVLFGWDASRSEGLAAAERARACDDQFAPAHARLGAEHLLDGKIERAILELERALELNPSHAPANALLGGAYALTGRPDEGVELVNRAMRLSPYEPQLFLYLWILARINYGRGRYEEAAANATGSIDRQRDFLPGYGVLAASYLRLDRPQDAVSVLRRIREIRPAFSLDAVRALVGMDDPTIVEDLSECIREAGFQE